MPAVRTWVSQGSGFELDDPNFPLCSRKVRLADDGGPRPSPPHIEISIHEIREVAHDWKRVEGNPLVFSAKTVSAVDPSSNELAIIGHGLLLGDGAVRVSTAGTPPGGMSTTTNYWVVVVDQDHIKLAPTFLDAMEAGAVIDITSPGSGGLQVVTTADSERVGQEIKRTATGIRLLTLTLRAFGKEGTNISPMQILTDVMAFLQLQVYELNEAGFSVSDLGASFAQGAIRPIPANRGGIREPRAEIDVAGYVGSSVSRLENRIATVEATVYPQSVDGTDLAAIPVSVTIDQGEA